MRKNTFVAFGLAAGLGSLAAGCSPATIDGQIADREFGAIKTAFFDTYDDGAGNKVVTVYLADYKWTCEEIQAAASSDTELTTEDPEQVVGSMSFTFGTWNEDEFTITGPIEEATYQVFDITDFSDYQNLTNGDHLVYVTAGFSNTSGTVDDGDLGEAGNVELSSVDITDSISGTFNVTTDAGQVLEGGFSVDLCEISD